MTVPSITSIGPHGAVRPGVQRKLSVFANIPASPVVAASLVDGNTDWIDGVLELADGSAYRGLSFGAEGKSISGECVFQTGLSLGYIFMNKVIAKFEFRYGWIHRILDGSILRRPDPCFDLSTNWQLRRA